MRDGRGKKRPVEWINGVRMREGVEVERLGENGRSTCSAMQNRESTKKANC